MILALDLIVLCLIVFAALGVIALSAIESLVLAVTHRQNKGRVNGWEAP